MSDEDGLAGIVLDFEKGAKILRLVQDAVEKRQGIFKNGLKGFLPQWNLPRDLEHNPQQRHTKDAERAAKLLFTKNFADRLQNSDFLMRCVTDAWESEDRRWIFFPEEVVKRPVSEIDSAVKSNFYLVSNKIELSPGQRYLNNARVLLDKYQGDPRNLIQGKTVAQAREAIMALEGFGTGLANLYIIESYGREIAVPDDPENIRFKVDRHKARIAINTDILSLHNGSRDKGTLHASRSVQKLEDLYLRICQEEGLQSWEVDAALWIIGSQVCTWERYSHCLSHCPLVGVCVANTELSHENGHFLVYKGGVRQDSRVKNGQMNLKF